MAVDVKDGGVLPILVQGDDKKVRAIQPAKKALEPDEMEEMDYLVGYENMNIIRSVTAGTVYELPLLLLLYKYSRCSNGGDSRVVVAVVVVFMVIV